MLSVGPVGPVGHELPPTLLLLLTPENALSLISLFVYTLYIFRNIYIYQTQQKNTKKILRNSNPMRTLPLCLSTTLINSVNRFRQHVLTLLLQL